MLKSSGSLVVDKTALPEGAVRAYGAECLAPYSGVPVLRRLRVRQIQFCTRWLYLLGQVSLFASVFRRTRETFVGRALLRLLAGYNRPFRDLREAAKAMAEYEGAGHVNPVHAMTLMGESARASASDYAALFHIRPILASVQRVFDFGGNVGNLFHCYAKYLDLPADFRWTVYDLPNNLAMGRALASEMGEGRLSFTSSLPDADGADLFIASGSIHYFETPLPEILAELSSKPAYILINRTPLVEGPTFATVQDAGPSRMACILYNRADLIQRFEQIGYELVESWSAFERSLRIPCYPDRSVAAYSGMFLRLQHPRSGDASCS